MVDMVRTDWHVRCLCCGGEWMEQHDGPAEEFHPGPCPECGAYEHRASTGGLDE